MEQTPVMENGGENITMSIGTYWTSIKPQPIPYISKITTLDHEGVYFDTWSSEVPCIRYEAYNSLLFVMENYIPLIKDEV